MTHPPTLHNSYTMGNKAIFLDKDGTLITDVPFNVNPELVRLQRGCSSLRLLQDAGYQLIVISNQSGIAKGYFTEAGLSCAVRRMWELLAKEGVYPHAFYFCPHHEDGTVAPYAHTCICRKPQPGLLLRAARDFDIALSKSWMIGDILDDVEAGKRAGCKTLLLDNGNETEWVTSPLRQPDLVTKDLAEAVQSILEKEQAHEPHL